MKPPVLSVLLVLTSVWGVSCLARSAKLGHSGRSLLNCNSVGARINGGEQACPGQFPYMCSVRLHTVHVHWCGGVLVAPNWVLTAAHCIDGVNGNGNPLVYCGGLSIHGEDAEKIQVVRSIVHPQWNGNPASGADIALMELESPSSKTPANLPTPGMEVSPGQKLTIAGWGRLVANGRFADTLRTADQLPYTPLTQCEQAFKQLTDPQFQLKSTLVCAGDGTQDSCQGDSGSPLLMGNIVVGVASFGAIDCGTTGVPGVYTGVSPFAEWIKTRGKNFGNIPRNSGSNSSSNKAFREGRLSRLSAGDSSCQDGSKCKGK